LFLGLPFNLAVPTPVISIAQMRDWERATWATGVAEASVMRRAGEAVARCARRMTRAGDSVLVLAGKGHNGDDARFAAEQLTGRTVRLVNVIEPSAAVKEASGFAGALIVDGLFGIGLNRPLVGDWLRLVQALNASRVPILAVDVPSGMNADTGELLGDAVRAAVTVTFGAMKQGLLLPKAAPLTGRLEVAAEIGLVPCPFRTEMNWTLPEDFGRFPPRRPVEGHKGTFGHLAIFAGSQGYHGAAVLAARGALRAMPGLVSVFTTERVYPLVAAQLAQAMVHPWVEGKALPKSCSAILIGPGLAGVDVPKPLVEEAIRLWQDSPLPIIADASALGWLPSGTTRSGTLRVVTPHPGEAAAMLGIAKAGVLSHRVAVLREIARTRGGCWVVLKGRQTLVGCGHGELFVNSSGNPELGQGGSGDVLAGYLGGWLAQPLLREDVRLLIRHAVWEHGHAAELLSARQRAWEMAELVATLGNAPQTGFGS
jgi:ADP-dependent NAD(P)H-hydrate dehydratase / NAD(P)H-hydrate epimerase